MKVKEIVKHLSIFPEDWEVDSIRFKDDKTKLRVSFDTDSICDKYYGEAKETVGNALRPKLIPIATSDPNKIPKDETTI